ncbi:MAG: CpaF family protein [Ardenticatenaceae bacterium]|nr:CpaF family protein [Ardenticatenaceae bacterium]HBY95170.1 type II secretion system protein E [Chloroflexota bacterium]
MSLLRRIEGKQSTPVTPSPAAPPASPPTGILNGRTEDLRLRRQSLATGRDTLTELKLQIQNKLIAELDPKMDLSRTDEVRHTIREMFETFLGQEGLVLTRAQRSGLFEQIVAEILGLGPIQTLIEDDSVSEIMVNGPRSVYAERQGKLGKTDITFDSDDHVLRIIDRIVSPIGRRVDESQPYVDARLPDGSRVNIVIPPLALNGPTITIRKFGRERLRAEDLLRFGSITAEALEFLKACVESRLNLVISGGTGSGKTTLLNVLSSFIPDDERIITIENAAELKLNQEHVITLESRAPNIEGRGEVSIRQLVINCLRMRPDRIVVGECRGGETLDMLQAMNTGHDGSLTTLHSNSPRDTLARMETMSLMAGMELPLRAIREQIASAVDLIVHQERFRDGTRKITSVTEVQGMEGDVIVMQEVFTFQQTGFENGKVIGRLRPTGVRPKCTERLEAHDIYLPPAIFGATRPY